MAEFRVMYPDPADFVASTAAARVNGYLGGYGTFARLQAEIDRLGLSPAGQTMLLERVGRE
jgi:peptide-methionine (S)-S-oxide reductase